MLLLVDNYDSFTYNLAHLFGELGVEVVVRRNDAVDADRAGTADPGEVVAPEIDQHDVLGAVLLGREQPLGVARAGVRRAGDRVQAGALALELDERLRRGADEREPVQLEQEQVRRRIHPA